jgi:hypothetical protein
MFLYFYGLYSQDFPFCARCILLDFNTATAKYVTASTEVLLSSHYSPGSPDFAQQARRRRAKLYSLAINVLSHGS